MSAKQAVVQSGLKEVELRGAPTATIMIEFLTY
jgi:hypothetical protein